MSYRQIKTTEQEPTNEDCPARSAINRVHEYCVEGTPRSAKTWYVCDLCGKRVARGQGLFYKESE